MMKLKLFAIFAAAAGDISVYGFTSFIGKGTTLHNDIVCTFLRFIFLQIYTFLRFLAKVPVENLYF